MTSKQVRRLRRLTPALLAAGVVLMIAFDATAPLLAGMTLMLAAVIGAAFMIAEPGFLAGDTPRDAAGENSKR